MSTQTSKPRISRKDFFRDLFGRVLTCFIGAAETAGNSWAVDRFLRLKDKLNQRCKK